MRFLANYVQSFHRPHYVCDFCFFSSRKRRIKKQPFYLLCLFVKHTMCAFHQGKEENNILPFLFPCLFINQTTRVSRLEAAPTLLVVIVRLQFNRSNPGISSFPKFPFHPRPDWLHLYP